MGEALLNVLVFQEIFSKMYLFWSFSGWMIIWWITLQGQGCLQPIKYVSCFAEIFLKCIFNLDPICFLIFTEGWCRTWCCFESMAATSNMRKPPFASAETLFRLYFDAITAFFTRASLDSTKAPPGSTGVTPGSRAAVKLESPSLS